MKYSPCLRSLYSMQITYFIYACFKNLAINNRKKHKIKSVSSKIIIGQLKCYHETLQLQNFATRHCPGYEHWNLSFMLYEFQKTKWIVQKFYRWIFKTAYSLQFLEFINITLEWEFGKVFETDTSELVSLFLTGLRVAIYLYIQDFSSFRIYD